MITTIQAYSLLFASNTGQGQSSQKSSGGEDFAAMLDMVDVNNAKNADCKKGDEANNSTDFLASIQQFIMNIDSSLFGMDNVQQVSAAGGNSSISVDELLNQGGPLPEFLDRIGARYGLDDEHKQALRNIAIQFKDTTGSPAEVQQMSTALQNAGIGISV